MVKIKGLEGIFSENVILLKEGERKTLRHLLLKSNTLRLLFQRGLEVLFPENVFLLKEGEIEMLRNKAIGDG